MIQEWVFELSNGKFVAAGVEHNPPCYDGLITGAMTSEAVNGEKFYRRVPAESHSTPAMVFAQLRKVVEQLCSQYGSDVSLVAVNNPAGIRLLSIQEQKSQVGDEVAITVKDGPSA
jgi:hypothetical protein